MYTPQIYIYIYIYMYIYIYIIMYLVWGLVTCELAALRKRRACLIDT